MKKNNSKQKSAPNDALADYYDLISSNLKPSQVTDEEVSMINFLAEPGSRVLDIGGGTGRHAITLAQQGFKVSVVDTSKGMLHALQKKDKNIKIYNQNIYNFKTKEKFDLVILFWNTFNEIALTKQNALILIKKMKSLLNKDGKILINIDDASQVDPAHFSFKYSKEVGEIKYILNWSTYKYNKKTNTSISKEVLTIYKNSELIKEAFDFIKQRYWSFEHINELAFRTQLKVTKRNVKSNNELYVVLSSNS